MQSFWKIPASERWRKQRVGSGFVLAVSLHGGRRCIIQQGGSSSRSNPKARSSLFTRRLSFFLCQSSLFHLLTPAEQISSKSSSSLYCCGAAGHLALEKTKRSAKSSCGAADRDDSSGGQNRRVASLAAG